MKILVTCPPMLGMIDEFIPEAARLGFELVSAKVTQTLSVEELIELVPQYDGWIIGDDPATRRVFEAGKAGGLKAAVKWGIGVDNVDFAACKDLGIPITNTPNMFGGEVADVAVGYVIGLARQLFLIDRGIRNGEWPKPAGMSLAGKHVALVGFGDIGRNVAKRLTAFDMPIIAYDPGNSDEGGIAGVERAAWPERIEEADFIVFSCSLNTHNHHMLSAEILAKVKPGVQVVNVARGPLIDEPALIAALESGNVAAAALDVFEAEPLSVDSPLRGMPQCIFGSHNGSNTRDAVRRASQQAMERLFGFLEN
ncbi:phosphoglycerate dehydrogenase [Nitrococcus mobilis]|uniref:Phosphoglycerate dehydrogenase n=1 Tax=Nitrococcus mobilis Nb-231 TaxID=314278 RepID=A4BRT3_9GAMM|nr:phosphoglycerate dehydrogenase [Nitrococcus mobilis]EAR21654.1 phosphoglycerate dehydrogenase [Nitrococcus mobilis Nb-231]